MVEGLSLILSGKLGGRYQVDAVTLKQLRVGLLDNQVLHNHQIERGLNEVKYLSSQRIGISLSLMGCLVANLTRGLPS